MRGSSGRGAARRRGGRAAGGGGGGAAVPAVKSGSRVGRVKREMGQKKKARPVAAGEKIFRLHVYYPALGPEGKRYWKAGIQIRVGIVTMFTVVAVGIRVSFKSNAG